MKPLVTLFILKLYARVNIFKSSGSFQIHFSLLTQIV